MRSHPFSAVLGEEGMHCRLVRGGEIHVESLD